MEIMSLMNTSSLTYDQPKHMSYCSLKESDDHKISTPDGVHVLPEDPPEELLDDPLEELLDDPLEELPDDGLRCAAVTVGAVTVSDDELRAIATTPIATTNATATPIPMKSGAFDFC